MINCHDSGAVEGCESQEQNSLLNPTVQNRWNFSLCQWTVALQAIWEARNQVVTSCCGGVRGVTSHIWTSTISESWTFKVAECFSVSSLIRKILQTKWHYCSNCNLFAKTTCDLASVWLQQDLCPLVLSHDDGIQPDYCLFAALGTNLATIEGFFLKTLHSCKIVF